MKVTRAQLELSSKCNFKCITCRHGYFNYGRNMPDNICDLLRTELLPGLKTLELQGTGESLLCPQTEIMIKAASEHGIETILITNGSLLDEPLMNKLVEANTQLVVSLDGSNSETYSLHKPIGSFEKIIDNITKLREIRSLNKRSGFSLVVNMVLTSLNREDIPGMIKLLSELKVDYLFVSEVRECMPDKDAWERLSLISSSSSPEFLGMIEQCKSLARQCGIGFAFNPNVKPTGLKKRVCEAPWKHIFVSADGNVSVCCELPIAFGNLKEQNLVDIINGDKLTQFRNDMLVGNYDNHCLNCCLPWGLPN